MTISRKLVLSSFGGDFRSSAEIVEEPVPDPGSGELVVRNRLAGVNGGRDQLMSRNALVGFPVTLPADGGVEAAAEVVAIGTLAGSMLPLLLKRLGLDPAVSSAPFVATLVDVAGIALYFEVAVYILRGTLL